MVTQRSFKGEIDLLKSNMQGAKALKTWSFALTTVISATFIEHVSYTEQKTHKGSKMIIPT